MDGVPDSQADSLGESQEGRTIFDLALPPFFELSNGQNLSCPLERRYPTGMTVCRSVVEVIFVRVRIVLRQLVPPSLGCLPRSRHLGVGHALLGLERGEWQRSTTGCR
jgi:hypothetical protein